MGIYPRHYFPGGHWRRDFPSLFVRLEILVTLDDVVLWSCGDVSGNTPYRDPDS